MLEFLPDEVEVVASTERKVDKVILHQDSLPQYYDSTDLATRKRVQPFLYFRGGDPIENATGYFKINAITGDIDGIEVVNKGSGYLYPPLIYYIYHYTPSHLD